MTVADYTIDLIRSVIKDEIPPEKPEEFSFNDVLTFVRKHKLENICYTAVKKLQNKPDKEVLEKWSFRCSTNQAQMVAQECEKERLAKAFLEEKIPYLPMKGWYLRSMYPMPEYRFMSDFDILIHREDRKRVRDLLYRLGYTGGYEDNGNEDSYMRNPYFHVEIHLDLINMLYKNWYDYYETIWEKARVNRGCEYQLNWNDYYIYMVVNFAKDYRTKGTGVRSVLDFYVFRDRHGSELDDQYINEQLDVLGIRDIEETVVNLSENWFGDSKKSCVDSQMTEKIVEDGIFGSRREMDRRRYESMTEDISFRPARKIMYVLRRAFPGYERMRYKYPVLIKRPFLLPVFWLIRGVKNFKRAVREFKAMKDIK